MPTTLFASSTFVSSSSATASLRALAAQPVQGAARIGRIKARLAAKKGTLRKAQDKSRIQRDINWINRSVGSERRGEIGRGEALNVAKLAGGHWRVSIA